MVSNELKRKILEVYGDNLEFAYKLIELDTESIRTVANEYSMFMSNEEFIALYESGRVDEAYKRAKLNIKKKALFSELCVIHDIVYLKSDSAATKK